MGTDKFAHGHWWGTIIMTPSPSSLGGENQRDSFSFRGMTSLGIEEDSSSPRVFWVLFQNVFDLVSPPSFPRVKIPPDWGVEPRSMPPPRPQPEGLLKFAKIIWFSTVRHLHQLKIIICSYFFFLSLGLRSFWRPLALGGTSEVYRLWKAASKMCHAGSKIHKVGILLPLGNGGEGRRGCARTRK